MFKVLLVDDQVILRESLKFIIEQDPEISVVACANDGREALKLCEQHMPDVVLMDIMMPGCDGIIGTKLIKEKHASIKILILTTFNEEEKIQKALENGADGYVLKDIKPEELILAIKSVKMGLGVMHKQTYSTVLKQFESGAKLEGRKKANLSVELTAREKEIITLIVDGKSNKEIAEVLFITEGTVKSTVSAILTKMELKDRTQLAVFAIKNNIV